MSSEEIELQKINKQKEELNKLKYLNSINLNKVNLILKQNKNVTLKPIISNNPLTILKPFNLNDKMLGKKRHCNNNLVNKKIIDRIKKKSEPIQHKIDTKILNTPTHLKYKNRTIDNSPNEDDLNTLSNRIERYCIISKRPIFKSKSKSPIKLEFNQEDNKETMKNLIN